MRLRKKIEYIVRGSQPLEQGDKTIFPPQHGIIIELLLDIRDQNEDIKELLSEIKASKS